MNTNTPTVLLGRVIGVHGVRGWVKIHSDCRPREAIFNYQTFILSNELTQQTLKLKHGRQQGKGLVAQFDGINDRDSAIALLNHTLSVARADLPELEAGEYYWADMIGLTVINRQQQTLGQVQSFVETGANDVMVVRHATGELLIPFILEHYIDVIDIGAGIISVDWCLDWS